MQKAQFSDPGTEKPVLHKEDMQTLHESFNHVLHSAPVCKTPAPHAVQGNLTNKKNDKIGSK